MSYNVGDTVVLDGIESVIIYDAGSEQSWGRYIVCDKNHDLVYYFEGKDFVNVEVSGKTYIDENAHWAYEWGCLQSYTDFGSNNATGITSQEIGDGLSNTNTLISLNLKAFPYRKIPWSRIWDKVKQFRNQINSDKWFVPTAKELKEVYNQKSYLNNISTEGWSGRYRGYASSSERASMGNNFHEIIFTDTGGSIDYTSKDSASNRTRLCRYATDSELPYKETIDISSSTQSSQIYYTTNNSTPTESSTLYTSQFEVNEPLIIKARGYKEGWIPSNISVLNLNTGETSEEMPENINEIPPFEYSDDNYNYSVNKTRESK